MSFALLLATGTTGLRGLLAVVGLRAGGLMADGRTGRERASARTRRVSVRRVQKPGQLRGARGTPRWSLSTTALPCIDQPEA